MSCAPHEILAVAKRIAENEEAPEAELRCAISRAYYSAFHAVASTFPPRENHVRIEGESSHAEVFGRVVAFSKGLHRGRSDAATIAKLMPQLRRMRNNADYRLDHEFNHPALLEFIVKAKFVMEKCIAVKIAQDSSRAKVG